MSTLSYAENVKVSGPKDLFNRSMSILLGWGNCMERNKFPCK